MRRRGLWDEYRNQSYPAKYITFAGTAIASVGLRPRHSVLGPSFLAIFRRPSSVLVKTLLCASSAAQVADADVDVTAVLEMTDMFGAPATQ